MREAYEAELGIALAEGLLSKEDADALLEEALRLERGPLELLRKRGRISEETLVTLHREARHQDEVEAARVGARLEEAPTFVKTPTETPERRPETPAFPVSGWDRYQCVRFLGQGGMGRVFLAYDPRLRRNVALKFVRDEDPDLTQRFISEARAQARVRHERVCEVYEVGEVQGKTYIAMQYVDGQPLNLLAHELTPEQKAMALRDAAEGVHAAHRAGLIHRDLKPSNILVERTVDGRLEPYVMDFGLARDWKEGVTATGSVLGTPHYMAPEQARGEVARLDRRADVYSLGATLYHLLTGVPPVPGTNALEVLNNISSEEPRPPRSLDPDIPRDLEAIVLKCLEKDRSARYDSARALAEDLERFLGGEPVQARSAGPWYRLRKKARKHQLVVAVSTIAFLLVALALGQAVRVRGEVAQREHLARRFTEQVEHIEALARYSGLSRLHDTRPDRKAIRARMAEIEEDIRQAGALAAGPGNYALGQGFLALGDEATARSYFENAWRQGFREPRVAYALALVMGHLYQQRLLEVERIKEPELRESRRHDIERRYRDPALAYLRQSEGAEAPSSGYVAALIAFYEDRLDDALAQLDKQDDGLPWSFELPKLRGDILLARATRHGRQGEREQALADFDAGRQAYAAAAAIGESVPTIHYALAELEHAAMLLELYGQGDVLPHYTRGLEAVSRALQAAPDHYGSKVLEASFHRRLAEYRTNQGGEVEPLLEKAIATVRSALVLAPARSEARLELGRSLWQWARYRQDRGMDPREQLRQAIEAFESIGPDDRNYEFHTLRGLVFQVWANYEEQIGEDSLPNRSRAIDAYLTAIGLDAHPAEAWLNLCFEYFKRASNPRASDPDGDLEQARATLDRARALNPKRVTSYYYGGRIHTMIAQRQRDRGGDARPELATALELYRKGLAINAGLWILHDGVGLILLEQAREAWDHGEEPFPLLDQAQAALAQSIALAPQLGYSYEHVGEVHFWRASYQRARGVDPRASLREAMKAYRQSLDRMPGSSTSWAFLGKAHRTLAAFELEHGRTPQQELARAAEALHTASERNPRDAEAWLQLGELQALEARWQPRQGQARAEKFEEAARSYQRALELEPQRLEARVTFGHFRRAQAAWLKQSGQDPGPSLRRGLELAQGVLAARPEWPEARLLRADLLLALADAATDSEQQRRWRGEALNDIDKALALNPHLEQTWKSQRLLVQRLVGSSPPSAAKME
ncbi:protein kinase domain-containing protein [Archangium sp.]|jgi:serine/threonine-protein kinase|uniref:protein kinase domain-containing protein n=1 Tax=Archangium sp. TaxID=1872627 RepID=UPI002EDAE839